MGAEGLWGGVEMSDEVVVVAAAILVENGRVLLARRPPGDRLAGRWELPGGKLEPGESPEDCLARELAEERGIEASVGSLFAKSTYRYPHATIQLIAFWVDTWSGEPVLRAHDSYVWSDPRDLGELLLAPADIPILARLCDGLS